MCYADPDFCCFHYADSVCLYKMSHKNRKKISKRKCNYWQTCEHKQSKTQISSSFKDTKKNQNNTKNIPDLSVEIDFAQ